MAGDDELDPDRAAILARRRRFIALAITGLATTGCKRPSPEPCLSVAAPDDSEPVPPEQTEPGPFVEEPGAPLEDESGGEQPVEPDGGELPKETPPEVCLKIAPSSNPSPKPCLKKRAPPQP